MEETLTSQKMAKIDLINSLEKISSEIPDRVLKLEGFIQKENEKDILYGKAQWFMAEDKVKRSRNISTRTSEYDWVNESLKADDSWK